MIVTETQDNLTVEIQDYLETEDDVTVEIENLSEEVEEPVVQDYLEPEDNVTVEIEDLPEERVTKLQVEEPVGQEIQDKQDFAAMNGVNISYEYEPVDQIKEEIPEPEEVTTTRAASQNPLLKVGVIGLVTLMFVAIIGGLINGSMNALNQSNKKIEPPSKQTEEVAAVIAKDDGTDKAALALTRQSVAMDKMKNAKPAPTTAPAPTPTAVPTTQPVAVKQSAPPPQPRTVAQRPAPRPEPVRRSPVRETQPIQLRSQPLPPPVTPTATPPVVDPMQQWLAVSNVGSFSANTPVAAKVETPEGIQGGLGKPKLVAVKQTRKPENSGGQSILIGTRTEGRLETPIVWSRATQGQSNQKYLIQLSKALKSSNGGEVLPKGSYIVAQISGASQSEYVQLQAITALVNSNGNTEEKSIPEGTILILAKNGQLLKAQTRKGSDLGSSIFSALLSGVTKAAEIQNRARTQTTTNSDGFSSSTTSNDNRDLLAGFTEGSLNQIVGDLQTQNQQQNRQFQTQNQVFVIEAGKEVQIFVNETFSL